MVRLAPTLNPDTSIDFKQIKQRFFDLNKSRLKRTKADLRERQRHFIELLPLLYHTNHPILPGYVSKQTPSGIPEYTPSNPTLNLAKKLARSFTYKKRAYRKYHIQAIYMMGSTGTIAYSSDKSDFDIWVCYDSSLNNGQIKHLKQKSLAIEEWAQSLDVDAHIFLVDPEEFRQGKHDSLNSESSGSAFHYLLLEEFYRTGLLLAGRYPTWWLVPPEHENEYDDFVQNIQTKRFVHTSENIDFGGLNKIPAEEFYGATLWLLYKGINSPYKSVLKTSLMEAYASEYPNIDILGLRFKMAVYNGENEINKLDPYLMMLHKVEEYFKRKNQPERLDLVRRSFYFKVNKKLSETTGVTNNWRYQLLTELANSWKWSTSQIFLLDSKENWKIQRVIDERTVLMNEITHSYRFLSKFARNNSNSNLIEAKDLHLLGRKLYAAFERKAGKIEIIYRGITNNLYESHISIHKLKGEDKKHFWVVYNGTVTADEASLYPPLKRAYSLIELLSWCYFNKITTSTTKTALFAPGTNISDKELKSINAIFEQTFAHEVLDDNNINELRRPATIKKVVSIINAGIDPFSQHTRAGNHLTSNRTDSLRYGGRLENLTHTIDQVLITSWHEVITFHYIGIEGIFQCLHDYMQWMPPSMGQRPPPVNSFSFSSYRSNAIANRVEKLFQTVIDCFYGNHSLPDTRYILAVEWSYYVLYLQNDSLHYHKAGNLEELKRYLSTPTPSFQHIVFDSETLHDDVLPLLYSRNKAGLIQVYFHIVDKYVHTYIVDENGALYHHDTEFFDAISLVNHYQQFFDSVANRMAFIKDEQGTETTSANYSFHYVQKNSDGQWELIRHKSCSIFQSSDYLALQVIGTKIDDDVHFTVYCDDQEYSTIEHGKTLYQRICRHILDNRNSNEKYPIYITDIDLSKSMLGPNYSETQTIHFLNYKKFFENKLLEKLHQESN